jgi:hypothetical protein
MKTKIILAAACLFVFSSCAQLHDVQISDADLSDAHQTKFDVKASDTGVDLKEAGELLKALSSNTASKTAGDTLSTVWSVMTFGPKTGNPTFSYDYANGLASSIDSICGSGKITMLSSIRESNKYPIISGEIVRYVGYCSNSSNHSKKEVLQ